MLLKISVALLILVCYLVSVQLEVKTIELKSLTRENAETIVKLKEMKETNEWILKNLDKKSNIVEMDKKEAELNLVNFYDKYNKKYGFRLIKYMQEEEESVFLKVEFRIKRSDSKLIYSLFELKNNTDLVLFFEKMNVGSNDFNGEMKIMNPILKKKEVREADDEGGYNEIS